MLGLGVGDIYDESQLDVIRRQVLLNEGEVFNSSLLDDSLLRLNRLGIFEEIKPEEIALPVTPPVSSVSAQSWQPALSHPDKSREQYP